MFTKAEEKIHLFHYLRNCLNTLIHIKFAMTVNVEQRPGKNILSEKCHNELIYDGTKPEAEGSLWCSGITSTSEICLLCHGAKWKKSRRRRRIWLQRQDVAIKNYTLQVTCFPLLLHRLKLNVIHQNPCSDLVYPTICFQFNFDSELSRKQMNEWSKNIFFISRFSSKTSKLRQKTLRRFRLLFQESRRV